MEDSCLIIPYKFLLNRRSFKLVISLNLVLRFKFLCLQLTESAIPKPICLHIQIKNDKELIWTADKYSSA